MAMDQQDERKQAETEQPASGQGAIRSAFLTRQNQGAGAGGEGETVAATLRGAYVSQVSRQTRRRDDAVKGSEETGGAVLRSIYAARAEVVVIAPRRAARPAPAPTRKAKAAKKARPARKARTAKARAPAKLKARRARTGPAAAAKRRPARKAARRR
jgi:hypothetical protein